MHWGPCEWSWWEADFEFQGEAIAVSTYIHPVWIIISPGGVNPTKCLSASGWDENSREVESVGKWRSFTIITKRILEEEHLIFLTPRPCYLIKRRNTRHKCRLHSAATVPCHSCSFWLFSTLLRCTSVIIVEGGEIFSLSFPLKQIKPLAAQEWWITGSERDKHSPEGWPQ